MNDDFEGIRGMPSSLGERSPDDNYKTFGDNFDHGHGPQDLIESNCLSCSSLSTT